MSPPELLELQLELRNPAVEPSGRLARPLNLQGVAERVCDVSGALRGGCLSPERDEARVGIRRDLDVVKQIARLPRSRLEVACRLERYARCVDQSRRVVDNFRSGGGRRGAEQGAVDREWLDLDDQLGPVNRLAAHRQDIGGGRKCHQDSQEQPFPTPEELAVSTQIPPAFGRRFAQGRDGGIQG